MIRPVVIGVAAILCTIEIKSARAGFWKEVGVAVWDAAKDAAKEHPNVGHGAKEGSHELIKKGVEGAVEGTIKGASPSDDGDNHD